MRAGNRLAQVSPLHYIPRYSWEHQSGEWKRLCLACPHWGGPVWVVGPGGSVGPGFGSEPVSTWPALNPTPVLGLYLLAVGSLGPGYDGLPRRAVVSGGGLHPGVLGDSWIPRTT